MSLQSVAYIVCDHYGCDEEVTGYSGRAAPVRRVARHQGWTVNAIEGHKLPRDYCPQHAPFHLPTEKNK
jgi:hypothetical protein